MSYTLLFSEGFWKIAKKLKNKDRIHFEYLTKKLKQLKENPAIGKPLSSVLKGKRRVHIGSFVLIYEVDEIKKVIKVLHYDHHDNIYQKKAK